MNYEELATDLRELLGPDVLELYAADDHLGVSLDDHTIALALLVKDDSGQALSLQIARDCPPQLAAYLAIKLDQLITTKVDVDHTFIAETVTRGDIH